MAGSIRVLIADDHAVVRQGLRLFLGLQEDIEVVGEAADGQEAVAQAEDLLPDVVLMDLMMPNLDGVGATAAIRESCPGAGILVLTSFTDESKVLPVLRAGASGFLMKDVDPADLAEAIRTVHRGEPLLHPEVTRRLLDHFTGGRAVPEGTVTIMFTDVEDSTGIVQRMGDEAARSLFAEHDAIIRDALRAHGGLEVEHPGDGFMAAFSSARKAVGCAVAIQRAFEGRQFRVRVGLHTGDVLAAEHGYFGKALNFACRVVSAAAGGQVLVSEVTHALAADEAEWRDAGETELKGLPGPHRLWEVVL